MLKQTARDPDVIDISDSDSASSLPPVRPPSNSINTDSVASPQRAPPHLVSLTSVPILLEQLPPLPPSSDDLEHDLGAGPSSPSRRDPSQNRLTPFDAAVRLAPRDTLPAPSSDSGSSGDILESEVVPIEPEQPSFVLSSGGSTSGDDSVPPPGSFDEGGSRTGRGRTTNVTSPRGPEPSRSSPSASRSDVVTEVELEESIANVSLHDPQPNTRAEKAIAQTVAAVGSIALDDDDQSSANEARLSGGTSASSRNTSGHKCSIAECGSRFSTTGQLHTHMSRDHGIRLSQETKKKKKGKRKASDVPATPTKRRTYAPRSEGQSSRASEAEHGSSEGSRGSAQSSNRYVKRTNTVGFEPFAQGISDHGYSVSMVIFKSND
jgi:hypothetical protein